MVGVTGFEPATPTSRSFTAIFHGDPWKATKAFKPTSYRRPNAREVRSFPVVADPNRHKIWTNGTLTWNNQSDSRICGSSPF
jgi:hypothetical protein